MSNSSYWKQRFAQLEAVQNQKGAAAYLEIEKQYQSALRELEGKINSWYGRLAANNGVSMAEARKMLSGAALKEFRWDVKDYIRHGQENAIDQRWMKELENASAKYHISQLEALKLQTQQSLELMFGNQLDSVDAVMKNIYLGGYYRTAYELQHGFRIGWDIAALDQRKIEKIIHKPWAVDGKNFSERIWSNKQKLISEVHKELTQNIILGQDPQKAIDAIARRMNTSKHNAGRLVMTEEAYFSSAAQKDCFNDLNVEQYEIVATLDSHTSEICQSLDGQVFPMKDYEPGITAPPFHVYCRSTTVPYFEDDFGQIGERAARGEDGKTYYVPADMSYQEWKETFVDGGDKMGLQEVKMIMEKPQNISYNIRNEKEFESVANGIKSEITKYASNASKWSGKININNDLLQKGVVGEKEWTCDISIANIADDGIIWHEMLHACSASYYAPDIYAHHQFIEEASVEFLKQQICQEKGIAHTPAYENLVPVLQAVNNKFHYGSDMEFAKELFNVPLPDRYKWLEDKVVDSLKGENVSFEDFNEVLLFVRNLKGGKNG